MEAKKSAGIGLILAMSMGLAMAQSSDNPPDLTYFTGDTKLACEAILCLASSTQPSECTPSLQRYFSIVKNGKHDDPTPVKRLRFLKQCPTANETENMRTLVQAMAYAAGSCNAQQLNIVLRHEKEVTECKRVSPGFINRENYDPLHPGQECTTKKITVINDKLPLYCAALFDHDYIRPGDLRRPIYTGVVDKGGKWID